MKYARLLVLLAVIGAVSRAPAVAEQSSRRSDEALTIGVTVDPMCTVAVTPRDSPPRDAVAVSCRNLRQSQPAPLVLEVEPRDGHDVVLIRF